MSKKAEVIVDKEMFETVNRMGPLLISMCERLVATRFPRTAFVQALQTIGTPQVEISLLDGAYGHLERITERKR